MSHLGAVLTDVYSPVVGGGGERPRVGEGGGSSFQKVTHPAPPALLGTEAWTGRSRSPAGSLHLPTPGGPPPLPQHRPSPVWHRAMGLGPHSVSPRSLRRQPHAASSVSQAFKLPFYLNLCPRIQAEKGPFQSQFLLYGFTGDHIGQLLEISCCSQHSRGSRGSRRL